MFPRLSLVFRSICLFIAPASVGILLPPALMAQKPAIELPSISSNDTRGIPHALEESAYFDFELRLREYFARKDSPDEIIALAHARPGYFDPELGHPVNVLAIFIYGNEGELRLYFRDSADRFYFRRISADEIATIRAFLGEHKVDRLPRLDAYLDNGTKTVDGERYRRVILGGTQYVYLHLTPQHGRRVMINNPEDRDPPEERHVRALSFFSQFRATEDENIEVRYEFHRPIPSLEVIYAHPAREILAVWKEGADLCVTVRDRWDAEAKEQHRVIRDGQLGEEVAERTTVASSLARIDDTTLIPARYSSNGRWVVGNRRQDGQLVCFDREQNTFVPIADEQTKAKCHPLYYVDAQNLFLLGCAEMGRIPHAQRTGDWRSVHQLSLFDPMTGNTINFSDKLSDNIISNGSLSHADLWLQELPTQLQSVTGQPHIVWVAKPHYEATWVGMYDTESFRGLSGDVIPYITFETKDMWVDQADEHVYVVYRGHLLRFPLKDIERGVEAIPNN